MLTHKLNQIIDTLDKLIKITDEDIKNIKKANHEAVFSNTTPKEKLAGKFMN